MWNELLNRNLENLSARFVEYDDTGRSGELIGMHYHDEMEVLLILEGFINCYVDNGMVSAKAGQILCVDSRIPHRTETGGGGCRYVVLQFVPEHFQLGRGGKHAVRYFYGFAHRCNTSVYVIDDKGCTVALGSAWEAHAGGWAGAEMFVLSCIYYLLGYMEKIGRLGKPNIPEEKVVKKLIPALEYMEEHYGQQELSLQTISKLLGLNSVYFSRLFKQSTGQGFTEYLNYLRVCKSEELLRNTNLSILEISLEVGFSSVSYYNRIFKRIKNCTPTVYRRAQFSTL